MKRWTDLVLVACAGGVALGQWFGPSSMEGLLGALLFGLVVLTIVSQRNALHLTLDSLNAAHKEQLESERRYRALFDACSDVILVHRFEDDGRPGQVVEVNEAACLGLGYSRAQLLAMTAEDVLAPEARSRRPGAHAGRSRRPAPSPTRPCRSPATDSACRSRSRRGSSTSAAAGSA